ncbi:TetR/AcrR family transcriptional regulator, partial [Burkholderia mallei]|nr:TetR/AcrR family transcriptional regulator [Burkholderia mallei]
MRNRNGDEQAATARHEAPARPPRCRLPADIRINQILDAALAEFSASGFAGARIDDIAARAGMSKGGVYTHFGSKDEIFEALLARTLMPPLPADRRRERLLDVLAPALDRARCTPAFGDQQTQHRDHRLARRPRVEVAREQIDDRRERVGHGRRRVRKFGRGIRSRRARLADRPRLARLARPGPLVG